jgi:hypothetical protein
MKLCIVQYSQLNRVTFVIYLSFFLNIQLSKLHKYEKYIIFKHLAFLRINTDT